MPVTFLVALSRAANTVAVLCRMQSWGLPFGNADLHRQRRSVAIQRLNLGLLVDAEHDRVLRRLEIQPDDVGDLRDQFRVGRKLESLHLPRLDPVLAPHPSNGSVPDPEVIGEKT
ncbi:hypothetical protein [Rhodococcus marinonascens]|uniref:hypothetical protein n=1 Tax=Rhodococcus marinonascens TaxID=38311 RepID=UPI0035A2271B